MRRFPLLPAFCLVVAALFLFLALPVAQGSATPAGRPATAPRPDGLSRALAASELRPTSSAAGVPCLQLPRTAPCGPSPDRPVVDLISNASDSGARLRVGITLPPSGANTASVLASFWVGLWVGGAPCSVDGASYLSVTLYPPFSPSVTPASPDWVAQVPVIDLVPSGSCDPLCQNASAQTSVGGAPTCEDNIVLGGGWPASPTVGRFAPGDRLSIVAWGSVGDATPLNVWANDSTVPSESAHWQYGAGATVTGQSVGPRYSVSNGSDGGWATPYDAAFGLTSCPSFAGPPACNTYNGLLENATPTPLVTSVDYWNATSAALEAYPWIATGSSSGACQGAPPLATCPDFSSYGGTDAYPTLAAVRAAGGVAWRLGGHSGAVADYGGNGAEYAPSGAATLAEPATVVVDSARGSAGVATVNLTVTDPRGAAEVRAGALWCAAGGLNFTQVQVPVSGTLPNVSVTLGLSDMDGSLTYWLSERASGGVWSPGTEETLSMTNGTSACVLPPPANPWLGPSNVTAVAGGYHVTWRENATGLRAFEVTAHDLTTGVNETRELGNVTAATVLGLSSSDPYSLSVAFLSLDGNSSSTTVASVGNPLPALSVSAASSGTTLWHGTTPTTLNLTISGGLAPYQLLAVLGNSTVTNATSASNLTNLSVLLAAGVGFGDVRITVTDANGVPADATPLLFDVWAGPLAPNGTMTGGADLVGLSWGSSVSPAAPVVRYVVFLTSNRTTAGTAYLAGTANTTLGGPLGGVEVWNTTNTSMAAPWVDNTTAYALVVPYDSFGPGFATPAPLEATPAPLTPGSIVGGPGGPAPYRATFTTILRTGTDDPVTEAVYSFPAFSFVNANATRTDPTTVFLNASARIETVGLVLVLLHVSDAFGGTAIVSSYVWVSPGAAPVVSAQANPASAYVGVAVTYTASATGTGPFVYTWTFGDGSAGSGASSAHAYARAGTFTATVLVADNGTGSSATLDVVENVFALPMVAIVASAGPNGSASFSFHATLIGGTGTGTFAWAFGDGSVARGENVTHDFRSGGLFTVNVTATDASLRTASASVTVDASLTSGTSSGGAGLSIFSPLVLGLLLVAILGWAVAVAVVLRMRHPAESEDEEEPTNWD